MGVVGVAACIGVGAYKYRHQPGGGLDRERAPDIELQLLGDQQDTDNDDASDDGGPGQEQGVDIRHQQCTGEGQDWEADSYGSWEGATTEPNKPLLQPRETTDEQHSV